MKILSVVCARAGSKGCKNKCVRKIGGKAVIDYSIEYSLSLGSNVKTVVSTDIEELIDDCARRGIAYIRREPSLCTDEARLDDVLADAVERQTDGSPQYCSLLYGNIPTRYPRLFAEALDFLEKNKKYDAVLSMQEVEKYQPEFMFPYNEEIIPDEAKPHYRRQSIPKKMIHDGHTVLFRSGAFLARLRGKLPFERRNLYSAYGTIIRPQINRELMADIDTENDFKVAEAIILRMGAGL